MLLYFTFFHNRGANKNYDGVENMKMEYTYYCGKNVGHPSAK